MISCHADNSNIYCQNEAYLPKVYYQNLVQAILNIKTEANFGFVTSRSDCEMPRQIKVNTKFVPDSVDMTTKTGLTRRKCP